MADADFEVSATHIAGMVRAATKLGVLEKVLPQVSPETRAVMASPHLQAWHPSAVLVELSDALRHECGLPAYTEAVAVMTSESMGPIVTPMLKIALTITGRTPATLFTRLHSSVRAGLRGVDITWKSTGLQSGQVRVRYPRPVSVDVRHAFDGVFRFIFGLTGHTGAIDAFSHDEGGRVLTLSVSWR